MESLLILGACLIVCVTISSLLHKRMTIKGNMYIDILIINCIVVGIIIGKLIP